MVNELQQGLRLDKMQTTASSSWQLEPHQALSALRESTLGNFPPSQMSSSMRYHAYCMLTETKQRAVSLTVSQQQKGGRKHVSNKSAGEYDSHSGLTFWCRRFISIAISFTNSILARIVGFLIALMATASDLFMMALYTCSHTISHADSGKVDLQHVVACIGIEICQQLMLEL